MGDPSPQRHPAGSRQTIAACGCAPSAAEPIDPCSCQETSFQPGIKPVWIDRSRGVLIQEDTLLERWARIKRKEKQFKLLAFLAACVFASVAVTAVATARIENHATAKAGVAIPVAPEDDALTNAQKSLAYRLLDDAGYGEVIDLWGDSYPSIAVEHGFAACRIGWLARSKGRLIQGAICDQKMVVVTPIR